MDRRQSIPVRSPRFRIPALALVAAVLVAAAQGASAADGARLYQRHCAACHGEGGQGGVGVPLALPAFQATATDEYLRKTIRLGRPGRVMPAFDQFSDAEVDAVIDHLRGLVEAPTDVELVEGPVDGDPRRGEQLYAEHCASCHGEDGGGGHGTGVTFSRPRDLPIVAPALNNRGFLAAASDPMIKTTLMRGRPGTPMDSYLELGLDEADIDDLVAYVRSFEDQPPPDGHAGNGDVGPMTLTVDSPYDLERTVSNVKRAVVGHNFRLIREQRLEDGLYPEEEVSDREVMIYACNFSFLYDALAIDPRVGLFLPCRITVVERDGQVTLMSINPKRLSALYNNRELDEACAKMYDQYMQIMEEATF